MAERAGAAMDVEFLAGNSEVALRGHGDNREGFVDLKQIDVADAPTDLVEQLSDRRDRRSREPLRLLAVGSVALDLGEHGESFAIDERTFCQDQRGGPVRIGGRSGRRDGAVGAERRLQAGDFGGIDF
jgi:hypothetical protein